MSAAINAVKVTGCRQLHFAGLDDIRANTAIRRRPRSSQRGYHATPTSKTH
jgi:hypothetical protein